MPQSVAVQNAVFRAVADPTRRAILGYLRRGELAAGEIASHFRVSRPAISRHIRVLRSARLVRERRDGRGRFYRLDAVPLRTLDEWVSDYRLFWQMRLEELKAYVEAMPSERPAPPATRSPTGRQTVRAQRRGRPR